MLCAITCDACHWKSATSLSLTRWRPVTYCFLTVHTEFFRILMWWSSFLEIIPRLKPGILVHIHDIFLPSDYPPSWRKFLFSEQYMPAAMLLCREAPIHPVLTNHFVCKDDELRRLALDLFKEKDGSFMDTARFRGASELTGSSFWRETR